MSPVDTSRRRSEDPQSDPPVQCADCESALGSGGGHTVSFLLLDQLTLPLVGCDEHREQFATICGLTTEDTAELLDRRPAGGVNCPSCHLAPNAPEQPVIPVQGGAVAVFACPEHQAEVVARFRTGLDTRRQLTASLDSPP